MIFRPSFEIGDLNSKLLKDILLNIKRLVVKDYVKTHTYKKVVCMLRVGVCNVAKHESGETGEHA